MDYKTQLTTILGKAPEVVFCPNYYQEVGQILARAESIGLAVPSWAATAGMVWKATQLPTS